MNTIDTKIKRVELPLEPPVTDEEKKSVLPPDPAVAKFILNDMRRRLGVLENSGQISNDIQQLKGSLKGAIDDLEVMLKELKNE